MISECGRSLGHLHQAEHAFLHACAAARGNDDHFDEFVRCAFDQARGDFTDHGTKGRRYKIREIDHAAARNAAPAKNTGHARRQTPLRPIRLLYEL